MSGPNETTEKLFPPPENPNPDAPIPIGPSIRHAFNEHRKGVNETLANFGVRLTALELRTPAPAHPQSLLGKVKGGAAGAARWVTVFSLLGEAAAGVANLLGRPDVEGPIRFVIGLFQGS